MDKLSDLMEQADNVSASRDHALTWGIISHDFKRRRGECANCKAWVYVNADPSGMEVEMHGSAVECPCEPEL